MTEQAAERFASALLQQFARERVFQFELPEGHNLEYVTKALEKMGCEVVHTAGTNTVSVKAPAPTA
ncbi:MAG TPA: hypothetical protein VGL56_20740 [Fimbriimonadaceae bacterium]|jgi:hypothetical protein